MKYTHILSSLLVMISSCGLHVDTVNGDQDSLKIDSPKVDTAKIDTIKADTMEVDSRTCLLYTSPSPRDS